MPGERRSPADVAHGTATVCLCEAYGLTRDQMLAEPAQRAVDFIQKAQNKTTGGWRYEPGDEGDACVTGWQVMALKKRQMAHLKVDPAAPEGAEEVARLGRFRPAEGELRIPARPRCQRYDDRRRPAVQSIPKRKTG